MSPEVLLRGIVCDLEKGGLNQDHHQSCKEANSITIKCDQFDISFSFQRNDNTTYSLNEIAVSYKNGSNATVNDMKELRAPNRFQLEQKYSCSETIKFGLSDGQVLEIKGFEFDLHSDEEKSKDKLPTVKCRNKPGKMLIPVIIGVSLLALMIVALAVYLYMRNA